MTHRTGSPKTWETKPHTADIGITAYGSTLADVFQHAAEGMFSLIGARGGETAFRATVSLAAPDAETLLVRWLNELLYLGTVNKIAVNVCRIRSVGNTSLTAEIEGCTMSPGHMPLREIKAATYHGLSIRECGDGYIASVIFDV